MIRIHSFVVTVVLATCSGAFSYETVETPIGPPDYVYRVQIGAPADKKEAQRLLEKASEAGLSPTIIVPVEPFYKVQVGQLDCYPDAHQLRDDLRKRGFFDAFCVFEDNVDQKEAVPVQLSEHSNGYGVQKLVLTTGPSVAGVHNSLPPPKELEKRSPNELTAILKPFLDSSESAGISKGYATYYYALAIERSGDQAMAKAAADLLSKLANGQVPTPEDFQRKAALQVADLQHYTLKDYSQAYRMYKTLLNTEWLQGQGRAEIQAEIAATFIEMMDSEKGNPADVRRKLKQLYQAMSNEFPEPKARVELMFSETFFWDRTKDSLATAREYALVLQHKYPHFKQIWAQAIWNEAVAVERQGNIEGAKAILAQAVNAEIPEHESFRNRLKPFSMEKRVASFMARLETKNGDTANPDLWRNYSDSIELFNPDLTLRVPGM